MPLNRHLTIHWEAAGLVDCQAAAATATFLTLARDWLRKRGGRFAWIFVRENGDGKGSHVHILLHAPAGTTLGNMQRRWLRAITGKSYRARTIKTERIGRTAGAASSAPDVYEANLARAVAYVLKGASPEAALAFGLARLEPGGSIIGKRCATSQNIGRAARQRRSLK
jgi:hypothetical protein